MNDESDTQESWSFTVNGELLPLLNTFSVADLIEHLGYKGKRIAVERNGEIVPKSQHGAIRLRAGDRYEIVVAVGGG